MDDETVAGGVPEHHGFAGAGHVVHQRLRDGSKDSRGIPSTTETPGSSLRLPRRAGDPAGIRSPRWAPAFSTINSHQLSHGRLMTILRRKASGRFQDAGEVEDRGPRGEQCRPPGSGVAVAGSRFSRFPASGPIPGKLPVSRATWDVRPRRRTASEPGRAGRPQVLAPTAVVEASRASS